MSHKIFNVSNVDELLVWKHMEEIGFDFMSLEKMMSIPFNTIGLTTEVSKYSDGGVKKSTDYSLSDKIAVRKIFEYIEDGMNITFQWMNLNNEVGCEKKEYKPLSDVDIDSIKRANRQRSITYLQSRSKGTAIEPHVNDILRHFKYEVDLFIQNNTDDFKKALETEEENIEVDGNMVVNVIFAYLNISLAENYTVKDSILKQINA